MKPNKIQESQGMEDTWAHFRDLYLKTNTQLLNDHECLDLKRNIAALTQTVLGAADVIIASALQGEFDLLNDVKFSQVIMDEISVATMGELLCCWRDLSGFDHDRGFGSYDTTGEPFLKHSELWSLPALVFARCPSISSQGGHENDSGSRSDSK